MASLDEARKPIVVQVSGDPNTQTRVSIDGFEIRGVVSVETKRSVDTGTDVSLHIKPDVVVYDLVDARFIPPKQPAPVEAEEDILEVEDVT